MDRSLAEVYVFPCKTSQFSTADTRVQQAQNDCLFQHRAFLQGSLQSFYLITM